ncbi:MAG: TIGR00730 family Rossman fold protein [Alphaproteobacteria bacterium]|nr:TIGR00730 family Rossman fold protein [Alphaproteobacteria bacterium]MBL7096290.1 TIGR00730 family Rossman fold protein [Alphaproteobacteria bacterium]
MDNKTPAICVFCGSSHGAKPAYAQAAIRLGTLIGERGFSMVFGGGNVGLMGECSRAARAAGAKVLGIIPGFLGRREVQGVDDVIVPDMQIRKQRMINEADAFIILPGGLGTLDELFEVISIAQLREHDKPIVVVNTDDFYAPLWPMLARVVHEGFAMRNVENLYHVVMTPEQAIEKIEQLLGHAPG